MENLELLIKQDLDDGIGMLSIAKKYGVGTSMVQKVKKQGKYYLDIKSGEIIFSAKKISFEEQAFHTRRFLDGKVEQINLIQDIDIGDFYYIKRCGDEATISYKERELYKFDINKLFGDGYKCRLYVKGELKTVVLKFEYEETIGEE